MKCKLCNQNEAQLTLVSLYHDGTPLDFEPSCWDCANNAIDSRKMMGDKFRQLDTSLSFIYNGSISYIEAVDLYYQELWS